MSVNLASKKFGFPRTVLKASGGGGLHPFKFIDASTTSPAVTKTKIACLSNLVDVLYPLSTMAITGIGGSGSYTDPIPLSEECYIYLKCTVSSTGEVTAAALTKTDPSDGELIKFNSATPPVQTEFYVILAQVVSGSKPSEPGYDFSIDGSPYHLTQVAFTHLRVEQRVSSGRIATLAVPV